MDFLKWESYYYDGIKFELWDQFEDNDYGDYTINEGDMYKVNSLDLYFSIEEFFDYDLEYIQYENEQKISDLEALHNHYIFNRYHSFYSTEDVNKSVSIELEKTANVEGFIQVIENGDKLSQNKYSYDNTYFTATIKVKNRFFVLQMIGPIRNMEYLYDDFKEIVYSVH